MVEEPEEEYWVAKVVVVAVEAHPFSVYHLSHLQEHGQQLHYCYCSLVDVSAQNVSAIDNNYVIEYSK